MMVVAPADLTDLPSGNVAFLATEIVDSMRLWETDSRSTREALDIHDGIVGATVRRHDGAIVATGGDSHAVAFQMASAAALCAIDLQRQFGIVDWPDALDLGVRMGIHSGDAHLSGGEYSGPALAIASRIAAVAQRGQVLLSSGIADGLPDEIDSVRIGHRWSDDESTPFPLAALVDPCLSVPSVEPNGGAEFGMDGERRQVTVVFVDFDNEHATDPEAHLDSIDERVADAVATIEAEGGHVASAGSPTMLPTSAIRGATKTVPVVRFVRHTRSFAPNRLGR